jgi:glyoxylase-like metal-dependent hydrolase (beta-lactamase superfamily II)
MQPTLTRRDFVAMAGLAVASAMVPSRTAWGADAPAHNPVDVIRSEGATAKIEVQALRGNVHVMMGSGGNIGVLAGEDGLLVVDSGVAASQQNLLRALEGIGRQPLKYVVNTHWHFDHTDGNAWMGSSGATIVAHENTRRRLATRTRVDGWDYTFDPSPAIALPVVALRGDTTLHVGGAAVRIDLYPPCHTDTDLRVTFPEADVLQVGDTWWNGHYPFIDYSTGGSIDGAIVAAEKNVELAGEQTLVIPGHGPVGGRRELIEFRDLLRSTRDAVAAMKKQGRSVKEVVAAKPTAAHDAKWGTFVIGPDTFVRLVYQGV